MEEDLKRISSDVKSNILGNILCKIIILFYKYKN